MTAELRIELLGGLRVSVGERQVPATEWRRSRAAGLVKLLALTPGHRLHREQVMDALWPDLVSLMRYGVRRGRIDTVRPEHTPAAMGRAARQDRHGGEVYVYRRAGQPCLVCAGPVLTAQLAGRNSYWCETCQPR